MTADKGAPNATDMDYPAHERNYSGFIKMLKWGTIIAAITTAVVVLIIGN